VIVVANTGDRRLLRITACAQPSTSINKTASLSPRNPAVNVLLRPRHVHRGISQADGVMPLAGNSTTVREASPTASKVASSVLTASGLVA